MHIRLIAVGGRQPSWVGEACGEYMRRLPRQWQFRLDVIAAARRGRAADAARAKAAEGRKVLQTLGAAEKLVVLDEAGQSWTSADLAGRLADWQAAGDDVALLIGGPDGLAPDCLHRADACWALTGLTLPHGLARVLVVEQLYRAWTLMAGHPYHRA